MRWAHVTCLCAVMLAGVVLIGPLMSIARAQAAPGPVVRNVPGSDQPSLVLILDDAVAEILVSEAIVLLLSTLGSGLLLGGVAAMDLWRERRDER
jgi:hypothetical protein